MESKISCVLCAEVARRLSVDLENITYLCDSCGDIYQLLCSHFGLPGDNCRQLLDPTFCTVCVVRDLIIEDVKNKNAPEKIVEFKLCNDCHMSVVNTN